jgi:hypothetical protein
LEDGQINCPEAPNPRLLTTKGKDARKTRYGRVVTLKVEAQGVLYPDPEDERNQKT